jgi:hypothetical protein
MRSKSVAIPEKSAFHILCRALRLNLEGEEAARSSIGGRNCHLRFPALCPRPQTTQPLWFSDAWWGVQLQ